MDSDLKKYALCSLCKEYLDIGKYHKQLTYLLQLVEDISYKETSKGTLFRRIQEHLLIYSTKLKRISRTKLIKLCPNTIYMLSNTGICKVCLIVLFILR